MGGLRIIDRVETIASLEIVIRRIGGRDDDIVAASGREAFGGVSIAQHIVTIARLDDFEVADPVTANLLTGYVGSIEVDDNGHNSCGIIERIYAVSAVIAVCCTIKVACDDVVTITGFDKVRTVAATEMIIASIAVQLLSLCAAGDRVVAPRQRERFRNSRSCRHRSRCRRRCQRPD